jgi:hypothetical protein
MQEYQIALIKLLSQVKKDDEFFSVLENLKRTPLSNISVNDLDELMNYGGEKDLKRGSNKLILKFAGDHHTVFYQEKLNRTNRQMQKSIDAFENSFPPNNSPQNSTPRFGM